MKPLSVSGKSGAGILAGKYGRLVAAAFLVLLTRLPFLSNGYGSDPDAWLVIKVAQDFARGLPYSASRLPGYPLPEFMYSLVLKFGGSYFACNFLSAVFSAASFVLFVLLLEKLNIKYPFYAAWAMVFTPVVFIASVSAMDYIWALAFLLASLLAVVYNKYSIAGVFLGLAVACRLTSFAILLPVFFLLLHFRLSPSSIFTNLTRMAFTTILLASIFYYPVFSRYGWDFLQFYDMPIPIEKVIYRYTAGVWGVLGALAITGFLLFSIIFRDRNLPSEETKGTSNYFFAASGIIIFSLIFFRLPHESGYLIPAIPFALIMFSHISVKTRFPAAFRVLAFFLMFAPFVLHLSGEGLVFKGSIVFDNAHRRNDLRYIGTVRERFAHASDVVIVAGWYYPWFQVMNAPNECWRFVYLLDDATLKEAVSEKKRINYLQKMDYFNMRSNGCNIKSVGARLIARPEE